jgi:hypothetical protein
MEDKKTLLLVTEDADGYDFDVYASVEEMLIIIQALAAKAAEIIENAEVH